MKKADLEESQKHRVAVSAQLLKDALINCGVKPTKSKKIAHLSFLADRGLLEVAISDGAQKSILIESRGSNSWGIVVDGKKIIRLLSTFSEGTQVELQPRTADLVIIQGRGRYTISAQDFSTLEFPAKLKETTREPIPEERLNRPLKSDVEQKNSWGFSLQIPWIKR